MPGNARQLCLFVLACLQCATTAHAAEPAIEEIVIDVPFHEAPDIHLDGHLNEPIWQELPAFDGMFVIDPDTLVPAGYATSVRYVYTRRGLYLGVDMEQPTDTLLSRLSGRDAFINRDEFGITLDTSGQGLYGYWFTTALGDSVKDGKVAPERQFTSQWDGPWRRASQVTANGWSTEMFLPWSMMAMPYRDGEREMGFWVTRKFAQADERWGSPPLPFTGRRFMTALGKLKFDDVNAGQQLALFPYISYGEDRIREEDEYRAGFDVFWRPTSNLQLTATANPDFGAVESDDVVVNLTAFEVFFPEKRLFFLEGNEVFRTTPRSRVSGSSSSSGPRQIASTFRPTPTTLLNTRRIGGVPRIDVPEDVDVAGEELGRPTELIGAVKLTGTTGALRYGVLTAFEDDVKRRGTRNGEPVRLRDDGRDFGVARLLYETNPARGGRFSTGYLGTLTRYSDDDAVVHGVDTHYLSPNGKFFWDNQIMFSDVDGETGRGMLSDFIYIPRRGIRHNLTLDFLDRNLDISDLGFIRRNDAIGGVYSYNVTKTQGLKRLRSRRASYLVSYEENNDGRQVRGGLFLRHRWQFRNLSEIATEFDYFPSRWDDRNSFGNGIFEIEDRFVAEVSYGTDSAKPVSISTLIGKRQEELGAWTTRAVFGVTFKPTDRFSLDADITYFRRKGWLVYFDERDFTTFSATDWQPRLAVDWFVNARHQVRLTMQWAGIRADEERRWRVPLEPGSLLPVARTPADTTRDFTISRIAAQLRYRWEIAPLSDLFVVYTRGSNLDNRVSDEFDSLFTDALRSPIISAFIVKLRYRFGR